MPDNPDVSWALADILHRLPHYGKAVDYYEGRHNLAFASERFVNAFGRLFQEFADNVCDDVVDEPVDRLQIERFTIAGDEPDTQAPADQAAPQSHASALLEDIWATTKGAARAGTVHLNAFRQGDGFLIVQTDPEGQVRFYVQKPEQMAVRYSSAYPDELDLAAKVWKSGPFWRMTLWKPDGRVERYATKGTSPGGGMPQARAFELYTPPVTEADPDPSSIVDGQPGDRIPVFHFPNGDVSEYGTTVLLDVYPLQDALNKAVSDMLVGMEFHALPQRWGTGIVLERDPATGEEINPFKSGAERFWRVGNAEAQMGQFPASDLTGFLDIQDSFKLEIARKGGLPAHAINLRGSTGSPSGISLLIAEGKLLKRVKDRARDWGITWREVAQEALRQAGVNVPLSVIGIEWAPAETRDEKAAAETSLIKSELGVSKRQILRELGYADELIREMLAEREAQVEEDNARADMMAQGRISPLTVGLAGGLENALGMPGPPVPPDGTPETA